MSIHYLGLTPLSRPQDTGQAEGIHVPKSITYDWTENRCCLAGVPLTQSDHHDTVGVHFDGEHPSPFGRQCTLELRDGAGGLLFSNDNWMESIQVQEIIDSGIPPTDDNEAAIVATLAPGSYTAVMRGANNTTGIGVVEIYDLAQYVPAKLANISTRGLVQTGDNVMIGGFIQDNQAMHVIVRALGPSLAQSGVPNALGDPTVELHDSQGTVLAFNDDWQDTNQVAIEQTGIAPPNERESVILTTLLPGPYTAIVRGKNDTTGVGLVEVYELP